MFGNNKNNERIYLFSLTHFYVGSKRVWIQRTIFYNIKKIGLNSGRSGYNLLHLLSPFGLLFVLWRALNKKLTLCLFVGNNKNRLHLLHKLIATNFFNATHIHFSITLYCYVYWFTGCSTLKKFVVHNFQSLLQQYLPFILIQFTVLSIFYVVNRIPRNWFFEWFFLTPWFNSYHAV